MDFLSFTVGLLLGTTGTILTIFLSVLFFTKRFIAKNQEIQEQSAKAFSESFREGFEKAIRAQRLAEAMKSRGPSRGHGGDDGNEPTH